MKAIIDMNKYGLDAVPLPVSMPRKQADQMITAMIETMPQLGSSDQERKMIAHVLRHVLTTRQTERLGGLCGMQHTGDLRYSAKKFSIFDRRQKCLGASLGVPC